MTRTGIIGGGASGMMAAIAAAQRGADVTVLERRDRVGKKLLATGNGRCNLGNLDMDVLRDYRSGSAERLPAFFERFGTQEMLRFLEENGLYVTDKNGYLYPYSGQASSVLSFFLEQLEWLNIKVVCDTEIRSINKEPSSKSRFAVRTQEKTWHFDTLILSCGSPAGVPAREKLGGYELAQGLGLSVKKPLPALTALRCQEKFYKSLSGVRCPADITLFVDKKAICAETGELQLTDYGISGIPVFQLSRYASEALSSKKEVSASIDFFPQLKPGQWEELCRRQYRVCEGMSAAFLVEGMLHKKLAAFFLSTSGLKPGDIVGPAAKKKIFQMFSRMRGLETHICAVNPVENAQVCMGGVRLAEVNDNLESIKIPGLFLCGEMLDVDGRCGGYNLQWAWTSGHIAGEEAAKGERVRKLPAKTAKENWKGDRK